MASIREYETKAGKRWEVRWREPDGTPTGRTASSESEAKRIKADAERRVRRLRAEAADSGINPTDVGLIGADFRTVALKRMELVRDPATRKANLARLENHVFPVIGSKPITMDASDLAACILSWSSQAHSTQATLFRIVSPVFTYAMERRAITSNPCKTETVKNVRPKAPKRRIYAWSNEWVTGVVKSIRPDLAIFPLLAAFCGLRQGEIFGLSPDDIVINESGERVIRVRRQISDQGRHMFKAPKHRGVQDDPRETPCPDYVWEAIQAYMEDYPPCPVTLPFAKGDDSEPLPRTVRLFLTTNRRNAWDSETFNNHVWHPVRAAVGIPQLNENGSHALRHWFAATQLTNGTSVTQLAAFLGHSTPAFTMQQYGRYAKSSDVATAAMDRLARTMTDGA
jgi:integrase